MAPSPRTAFENYFYGTVEAETTEATPKKKKSDNKMQPPNSESRGMFERRRRRKQVQNNSSSVTTSHKPKSKPKKKIDIDPYDSDPGESYREHCETNRFKTCLAVPKFLTNSNNNNNKKQIDTAPPSPIDTTIPSSLPPHTTRVRYSLRSSITDGSAAQPRGPSVMERRKLRPNAIKVNVSHWSDEGGRPYMEDRYVIEDLDSVQVEVSPITTSDSDTVEVYYGPKKARRLNMPLSFFGIYDGHGGQHASQFCADWMTSYLRNDPHYPYDLGYSLKNAFLNIDNDFVSTGQPDGTTACCVTLVGGRRIVCANAGDSRAIVVRADGSVVRLSRDHKPGMPDETKRISDLGGRVIYWGRWRVEGLLAVSRAVGDASLKPYITAEPEICEYDVCKDDLFLILSSDGVFDVCENEEAAHVVIASSCVMEDGRLKVDTDRFKWAARNLCEHAKSCGSADNFSAIVVDLKSCHNKSAESGRYEP